MKLNKVLSLVFSLVALLFGLISVIKEAKDDSKQFAVYVGLIVIAAVLFAIITAASLVGKGNDTLYVVPVGLAIMTSFLFTKNVGSSLGSVESASASFYLFLVAGLFASIVFMKKYKGCAIAAICITGLFIYNPVNLFAALADSKVKFVEMGLVAFAATYVSFMLAFADPFFNAVQKAPKAEKAPVAEVKVEEAPVAEEANTEEAPVAEEAPATEEAKLNY